MDKTIYQWLDEYGESHQNPTNKTIHNICIPLIFMTSIGLLWDLPVPELFLTVPYLNWVSIAAVLVALFYLRLSIPIAIGMMLFSIASIFAIRSYDMTNYSDVWLASLLLFAACWVLQFVGHIKEGKKPSFFKDLQYLLIGPAWIIGHLYQKLGIKY